MRFTLIDRITALNPGAIIFEAVAGDIDPELLFDTGLYQPGAKTADVQKWLRAEAYRPLPAKTGLFQRPETPRQDASRHDQRIRAFAVIIDAPVIWQNLVDALEMLTSMRGEQILRIKGIVNVANEPTPRAIHAVQHTIYPAARLPLWPDQDHRTRLVFITRDLDEQFVRDTLASFVG